MINSHSSKRCLLTYELLEKLRGITEDQLRSAIRRNHLHPKRLPNGLFVWPPEAVEEAKKYFNTRKEESLFDRANQIERGEQC